MKGHIAKKGNQHYFILDIGYDENGKRKQKWFLGGKTERATAKMMTLKIAKIMKDEYIEPADIKYANYLEDWITSKKRDLRKSTHEVYTHYIKMILPYLGNKKLDKVTPLHIDTMIAGLSETMASATVRKAYNITNQSFRKAVSLGMISKNPCDQVDPPKIHKTKMNYWSKSEVQRFLQVAEKDPLWIVFFLAIKTGMRQGEILALTWDNIIGNTIVVEHSKTDAGRRTIAITDSDIEELNKHRLKQKEMIDKSLIEYEDNDLVIATKTGKPIGPRNLLRSFDRIIAQNDLRKIRFHDLRHTHATMMLLAGVHAKIVSERLGHSSIKITLDTYSHVLPNMQEQAIHQFENLLGS